MKLNTSYVIAAVLILLGAMWFAFNNASDDTPREASTPARAKESAAQITPSVLIRRITASEHPNILELYGQTGVNREVALKAQTMGLVSEILAREGHRVKQGDVICRQDLNARQALVEQAKAALRQSETELDAARILAEKGFQSETRVTALSAQRDGALAALKQAEIEADNINIRAPFSGIWERQDAQIGAFLSPGMSCGLLVDLSPLKVTVQLTESQIGLISRNSTADVLLATGERRSGKIVFIEAKANPSTRTFKAEIHVPNSDFLLKAGVTATVRISSGITLAQRVPGNILSLADNGKVGIRYIDNQNIVRFAEVVTIDSNETDLWVTGLPDETRVIVEGQDFVSVGMDVNFSEEPMSPSATPSSVNSQ